MSSRVEVKNPTTTWGSRLPWLAAAVLAGVPHVLRLRLLRIRGFNPDEFEHLHFAWLISKGFLPYRDYFEHHTPWLHYLTAPILAAYDVETSVTDAVTAITRARQLSWLFTGAVLALTVLIGLRFRGRLVACAAAVLLADASFFQGKCLEFRPDVAASALLAASVLLTMKGLGGPAGRWPQVASFAGGGLCLGAALMFTQKVLFVGPAFALTLLAYVLRSEGEALRHRIRNVAIETGGFLAPALATWAFFASRGAGRLFLKMNLGVNLGWPGVGPEGFLREMLVQDALLVILGALGLVLAAARVWRGPRKPGADLLIASVAVSLGLGVFVLPAVTRHYFLLGLPFVALLAADALEATAAAVVRRLQAAGRKVADRAMEAGFTVVLVLVSIVPMVRFASSFGRGNSGALDAIRYVLRNTAPWETVLDGYTGFAPFRRHGYYYPFLHSHTLAIQSPDERRQLVDGLRSGAIAPKLVLRDHYLEEGVTAEVAAFIGSHYVRYGPEPVHVRLFDGGRGWWYDEGPRTLGWAEAGSGQPQLYVGEGWKQPEVEGGLSVRHSRGRRSELAVPIRRVAEYTVVVRALARAGSAPLALALSVQGERLGRRCTSEGWAEYAFPLPARLVRSGMNELVLSYPPARECGERPSGQDAELTVASLELRPAVAAGDARR